MAPLAQAARLRGHPPGRAKQAPGRGVDPLWPSFGLLEPSDLDIVLGIFLSTFIFHPFIRCTDKNRQKLALGTESVG